MLSLIVFYLHRSSRVATMAEAGVGALNQNLSQCQAEEIKKIHKLWLCVYLIFRCFVKAPMCISLLRIIESRITLRYIVWGLIVIVGFTFTAT